MDLLQVVASPHPGCGRFRGNPVARGAPGLRGCGSDGHPDSIAGVDDDEEVEQVGVEHVFAGGRIGVVPCAAGSASTALEGHTRARRAHAANEGHTLRLSQETLQHHR